MKTGEKNILKILRGTSVGMFLGDEQGNEVLLPHKYIPDGASLGQDIEVFIYRDSEDRLIATTLEPSVSLNQFAVLEVVGVSAFGAFCHWGLEKDLLVPLKEQNQKLNVGDWAIIYLYLDEQTDRLVGTAKIHKYLIDEADSDIEIGQEVNLLVYERTDLGHNVIINNKYKGLVFYNETFKRVAWGDTLKGFVKNIREDGKIDISLQPVGFLKSRDSNTQIIIEKLKESGGVLELSDNSDPYDIMNTLQMSKKSFKKAIGGLYKEGKIDIRADSIVFLDDKK